MTAMVRLLYPRLSLRYQHCIGILVLSSEVKERMISGRRIVRSSAAAAPSPLGGSHAPRTPPVTAPARQQLVAPLDEEERRRESKTAAYAEPSLPMYHV